MDKTVPEVPTSILGLACSLSLSFVIGFALAYSIFFVGSAVVGVGFFFLVLPAIVLSAVPVVVTFERPCRDKAGFIGVRLLEYLSFGILLSANGRTFCGKPLGREPIAFFAVLGLNLVALLLYGTIHYSPAFASMLKDMEARPLRLLAAFSCGSGTGALKLPDTE